MTAGGPRPLAGDGMRRSPILNSIPRAGFDRPKAIAYGKLVNGVDACKYGKQWVISTEALKQEYGQPKTRG